MEHTRTSTIGNKVREWFYQLLSATRTRASLRLLAGALLMLLGAILGVLGMLGFIISMRRIEYVLTVSLFCIGSGLSLLLSGSVCVLTGRG